MLNKFFEWKKIRVLLQYAVYMLLALLLQGILFSRISIFGVKGMLMPAAVVGAGLYLGGVRGAVFGLFMGIFTDMNFSENTVLFTVLFSAIGFFSGLAAEYYVRRGFGTFMILGTAACLLTCLVQMLTAVIAHGAEIFPALLTALLQCLVSVIPMMLLYLPFRKRKDNE